eukprot:8562419-Alexandrium_andersonii.AAC.1
MSSRASSRAMRCCCTAATTARPHCRQGAQPRGTRAGPAQQAGMARRRRESDASSTLDAASGAGISISRSSAERSAASSSSFSGSHSEGPQTSRNSTAGHTRAPNTSACETLAAVVQGAAAPARASACDPGAKRA